MVSIGEHVFRNCILFLCLHVCRNRLRGGLSDLDVTGSRSPVVKLRHIRYVLLVNSQNKLNLLLWPSLYLCSKQNTLHRTFFYKKKHLNFLGGTFLLYFLKYFLKTAC